MAVHKRQKLLNVSKFISFPADLFIVSSSCLYAARTQHASFCDVWQETRGFVDIRNINIKPVGMRWNAHSDNIFTNTIPNTIHYWLSMDTAQNNITKRLVRGPAHSENICSFRCIGFVKLREQKDLRTMEKGVI